MVKRKSFVFLCISLFIIVVVMSFIILTHLPKGCDYMWYRMDCVEICEDGTFAWEGEISSTFYVGEHSEDNYISNNKLYMKYIMFLLRTTPTHKTDYIPNDVQLVEILFSDVSAHDQAKIYYIAYDFDKDKTYFYKNNMWYEADVGNRLDNVIVDLMDSQYNTLALRWRGQSTFAYEEFVDTDWNNATFRYNLHWKPIVSEALMKEYDYCDNDFKNTEAHTIQTQEDALLLAAEELGYDFPIGFVFYDETCGYWMVELCDTEGMTLTVSEESIIFLRQNCRTVIIDDCGRTIEVYRGVTRYAPFLETEDR